MLSPHPGFKILPAALSRFDSSSDALPGASDGDALLFFQRKERNGDLDRERTLRRDSLLAGVGAERTEHRRGFRTQIAVTHTNTQSRFAHSGELVPKISSMNS